MKMAEIDAKKQVRDPGGLIAAREDEDEHVLAAAAGALGGFADEQAAEVLERVKFRDPSVAVRRAASHAHGMAIERLQEKRGELPEGWRMRTAAAAQGPCRHAGERRVLTTPSLLSSTNTFFLRTFSG
jgi:HEAT repeat protein